MRLAYQICTLKIGVSKWRRSGQKQVLAVLPAREKPELHHHMPLAQSEGPSEDCIQNASQHYAILLSTGWTLQIYPILTCCQNGWKASRNYTCRPQHPRTPASREKKTRSTTPIKPTKGFDMLWLWLGFCYLLLPKHVKTLASEPLRHLCCQDLQDALSQQTLTTSWCS